MKPGKRERVQLPNETRYIRRDSRGRFTSAQVDVGRSSRSDQQQHSSNLPKRGQGDRGDRPTS
jgi:hypothetical protein